MPSLPDPYRRPVATSSSCPPRFNGIERRSLRAGVLACWLVVGQIAIGNSQAATADGPVAAEATGSGPVEMTVVVETLQIEKRGDGSEVRRWVPARRLSAGDEVHYTVRVRNPGKSPVTDVVVTKRLPFGVHYQAGSATGPACHIHFSADGGESFTPPETSSRPGKGKPARSGSRKPPAPDYTHVRWVMTRPLAPGATALLRFRATFS
jgi:uncharacterized repeat protein (TIGR01451 family)